MSFGVKIPSILGVAFMLFLTISQGTCEDVFKTGLENFSQNIFHQLALHRSGENIIISPFSIQTCLAMVRMGAGGETATKLNHDLGFTGQSSESLADHYYKLLSKYENSGIVQTANKIYVMKDYELVDKYKEVISQKFLSSVENIDFSKSVQAAKTMNSWVETKTHDLIKGLVDPDALGSSTSVFLLSAIYFKGTWQTPFDKEDTLSWDFHTDASNKIKVPLMNKQDTVPYGAFPELNARVIRLPYKDSDLSMWIFLPDSITGLSDMEKKLESMKLSSMAQKMGAPRPVQMLIPKFKAEFSMELKDTFKAMGMSSLFENTDFSKMLKTSEEVYVSNVIHKAFIEVDESGTTAAAATGVGMGTRTIYENDVVQFIVDHPFYYVIANEDFVPLFQGTVVKF